MAAEIEISTDDINVGVVGFEPRECEVCRVELSDYVRRHVLTECLQNLRKRIEQLEPKEGK